MAAKREANEPSPAQGLDFAERNDPTQEGPAFDDPVPDGPVPDGPVPDEQLSEDEVRGENVGLEMKDRSFQIDDSVIPDAQLTALIEPYQHQMHASMDEVIGEALEDIVRGRPESPLGNLVADALLWQARQRFGDEVSMSLVNNGGIRLPALMQGPITVADVYQLVPFDNRLVVLTMSGEQILALVQDLAKKGGEPYSGLSYAITDHGTRIMDVRIDGQIVTSDGTYQLVTLDYLASIGREYSILQEAEKRVDDTTFLRDAVIEYIRTQGRIEPSIDGRVVNESQE